ncbi:hypothetical protein V2G26_003842 [Clonostachys chloroleuca]
MSDLIRPEPPSRSLHGLVAIVTGAADSGIGNGRTLSMLLAADRCRVLRLHRNFDWAEQTVQMVKENIAGAQALVVLSDVTSAADCESAINAALQQFGRLDILVNNLVVSGAPGTAVEVDMEQWAKGLELNVSSMVQMAKYAIPAMMKNMGEIKGSIINMGSIAGLKGGTPHLLYPTAKCAVVNLTRAMAAQHALEGIRVNCICPGMLYTPMMYANGMSEEARQARQKRSLLGTEGNGWDAACATVFLAGPHARWITGFIFPVDAGTTAAVGIGLPKTASVNG